MLLGNSSRNVLDGGEAKDTLTGGASEDALMAREPATASAGIKDTIDCGSPAASVPPQTFMGVSIGSTSAGDSLDADLVDVPPGAKPPASCETVTVGPREGGPERRRGRERDADRGGQAEGAPALPARRRPHVRGNAAASRAKR